MSWLEDRKVRHLYRSPDGSREEVLEMPAKFDRPATYKGCDFVETLPDRDLPMTKVQFDRSGRVGYRIDVGNGKQIVRSATRERYEHMVGNTGRDKLREAKRQGYDLGLNDSVYTKSYKKKVEEAKVNKAQTQARVLKKIVQGGK